MQDFVEAQILIKPSTAIPKRTSEGALLTDLLGNFMTPGFGDDAGLLRESISPFASPYGASAQNVSITGLSSIAFLPDGTARIGTSYDAASEGKAQRGFYIAPREAVLDAKIGTNAADFDGGNTDINWTAVSGTWQTAPALTVGGGTALFNRGVQMIQVAKTSGQIPANRGHCVRFSLQGAINRSGPTQFVRHFFGDKYCLILQPGNSPALARVTYSAQGNGGTLQLIRRFKEFPTTKPTGIYRFSIYRIGGRLVIEQDGIVVWLFDAQVAASQTATRANVKDVSWGTAGWQIEVQNTRVRAEYSTVKWSAPNGTRFTGTLTRTANLGKEPDANAAKVGVCAGWKRKGTTATVAPSIAGSGVSYTLTLTANVDGIDTPFIDKVIVQYAPVWGAPAETYIDVRNCTETLSLSFVAPPDAAGAQGTLTLERNRLDQIFTGTNGNANWKDYIQMWNPVTINLKRAGAAFSKVFQGYIFKPSLSSGLGNDRHQTLVLRDPMVRLQKLGECNNAPIDHRYAPLDFFFARKQSGNGGYDENGQVAGGALYAAECVQEILRIALGETEAARINGDGDPLRFIPANHPALISTDNDTAGWAQIDAIGAADSPVSGGNWLYPPPFGSSAYDWIMELAKRDRCVFYYGWPDGTNGDWPVPIYGRLERILTVAPVPLHVLPDVANGTDWTRLLQSMESERRPERDINKVDVWGAEATGLEGIVPSLRIASASLPVSDPRSAIHTWERTLIIRDPLALLGAEAIADGVIDLLTGVDMQWPSFTFEGDERVGLGHIVSAALTGPEADLSSDLNGVRFRIERIDHNIDFNASPGNYKMTVHPRPLTAGEAEGFNRNLNAR